MFSQDKRGPRGPERKGKTGQDEKRIETGKTEGKTEGKTGGKTEGFKDH